MNRTVNARIFNLSSLQDSFDSWVVIKNAQHPVSTCFIAMSRNKLLVFVAAFTVAYAVKGEMHPVKTSVLDKAKSKKLKITTYPMECQ